MKRKQIAQFLSSLGLITDLDFAQRTFSENFINSKTFPMARELIEVPMPQKCLS